MGTDMHMMVEVIHGDGKGWHPLTNQDTIYESPRDYVLFSMLGDVRNRTGRGTRTWREPAKIRTDDGDLVDFPGFWYDTDDGGHSTLVPIATPRGIPDDANPKWVEYCERWRIKTNEEDLHISWIELEELVNADWNQQIERTAVTTEEEYLRWRDTAQMPKTLAHDAGGPGLRIVTPEEYEAGERGEVATNVRITWVDSVRDATGNFIDMFREMYENKPAASNIRLLVLFES